MNLNNTLLVKPLGQRVLEINFSFVVKLLNTHMFVAYSASWVSRNEHIKVTRFFLIFKKLAFRIKLYASDNE